MAKRAHDALLEDLVPVAPSDGERPVKKHTLDSDEEDEATDSKYNLLHEDDIEGEEEGTVAREGDVAITPFNMREEMAEGHFDADGNYFWRKQTEIRDAWLDDIDDTKVAESGSAEDDAEPESSDEDTQTGIPDAERAELLKQMLPLLQPAETVAAALRRLGGGRSRQSASARWRQKRAGGATAAAGATEAAAAAAEVRQQAVADMDRLTGLADRLLSDGANDVYQLSREAVQHQVSQLEEKLRSVAGESPSRLPAATPADADLDIFADELDKKTGAAATDGRAGDAQPAGEAGNGEANASATQTASGDDGGGGGEAVRKADSADEEEQGEEEVSWEFRWTEEAAAEVHGPHGSDEMLAWQQSGYFSDAVQVRRAGTERFYPAKRIDFELYL